MTSKVYHLGRETAEQIEALKEAEKVAAYCDLDKKQTLQLRLLTEEIAGMMQGITGECQADFWFETEGKKCTLFLSSNRNLDIETRKALVEASTSKKNNAQKGIMGKIRNMFEEYLINAASGVAMSNYYAGMMAPSGSEVFWSIQSYKNAIAQNRKEHREEWDELEQSIVANLADEITIGVRLMNVEIQVTKDFSKK